MPTTAKITVSMRPPHWVVSTLGSHGGSPLIKIRTITGKTSHPAPTTQRIARNARAFQKIPIGTKSASAIPPIQRRSVVLHGSSASTRAPAPIAMAVSRNSPLHTPALAPTSRAAR
jgi:hypothetical protein